MKITLPKYPRFAKPMTFLLSPLLLLNPTDYLDIRAESLVMQRGGLRCQTAYPGNNRNSINSPDSRGSQILYDCRTNFLNI